MNARLAVIPALALLLAGCGHDTGASTGTSTVASSTTVPATTTLPLPVFIVGTPGLYPPDPLPGSLGANGSGCPSPSGGLPDGIWFGSLLEVSPGLARFDPQCFYFGEAAEAAAADDGVELPGLHYVRNPGPDSLTLPISPDTPAYSIDPTTDPLGFLTFSLREWPAQSGGYTPCPGELCSVWLYVNGGAVTEILEQYLP